MRPPVSEPAIDPVDELIFGVKRCSVCGRVLPANTEYFACDSSRPDGLTSQCRSCRRAIGSARYHRRAPSGQVRLWL